MLDPLFVQWTPLPTLDQDLYMFCPDPNLTVHFSFWILWLHLKLFYIVYRMIYFFVVCVLAGIGNYMERNDDKIVIDVDVVHNEIYDDEIAFWIFSDCLQQNLLHH